MEPSRFIQICLIIQLVLIAEGTDTFVVKRSDDFPLHDCLSGNIDLLFVADAAIGKDEHEALTADQNVSKDKTLDSNGDTKSQYTSQTPELRSDKGGSSEVRYHSESYKAQMRLFSRLIDVFTAPDENHLERLRVALVVSVGANETAPRSGQIVTKFGFNEYQSKAVAKKSIVQDTITPTMFSYPVAAAEYVITQLDGRKRKGFGSRNMGDGKNFGAREDSRKVVIIACGHHIAPDMYHMTNSSLHLFTSTNVKFMFVFQNYFYWYLITAVFPKNNVLLVNSEPPSTFWNQNIPMSLCCKCENDWISYKPSVPSEMVASASCYKLLGTLDDVNWQDAYSLCKFSSFSLASIETLDELQSMRQQITGVLYDKIKNRDVVEYTNTHGHHVDVIIGLRREVTGFRKHFRWGTGIPLIYSNWATGQPSGGYSKACVVWRFALRGKIVVNNSYNNQSNVSAGDLVSGNEGFITSDAWYTVPCGHRIARLYLCEILPKSSGAPIDVDNTNLMTLQGSPPAERVKSAIDKGELGFIVKPNKQAYLASVSKMLVAQDSRANRYDYILKTGKQYQNVSIDTLQMFSCGDGKATAYTFVCDHNTDCPNKYDETICSYPICDSSTEFKCNTGHCLPRRRMCDLFIDCPDGSDEAYCTSCSHSQGLCPDGSCIPKNWFADGEVDCPGNTFSTVEEEMASTRDHSISECVIMCNRTKCVSADELGDGFVNCQGPEGPIDEVLGQLEAMPCYTDESNITVKYNNWAPRCVYIKDRYEGVIGCKNMAHLQGCENITCSPGYVKCPNAYCIPMHYVNNNIFDCPLGEDEYTGPLDCSGYFKCASSDVCLHPLYVCDNHPNCPQKDDELNCDVPCREGFLCIAGTVLPTDYDKSKPLTDLTFIDRRTRYLDLSGINLNQVFPNTGVDQFENLIRVNFSNCGIRSVKAPNAFNDDLKTVVWLDMSYNLITDIPNLSIFRDMVSLRVLNLSRNYDLESFDTNSFDAHSQSELRELDLSFTKISHFSFQHFWHLEHLTHLNLRGTQISCMGSSMFPVHFSLEVLDLRDIPLQEFHPGTFKNITIFSTMYTDYFELCCPQIHSSQTKPGTCVAPKDTFSSCSDLMHEVILRLLLWVNGCLAVIGNLVVIVYRLFYDRTILHMAHGHFVTHLGIADLLMGIYLLIIAIADAFYRGRYVWNEMAWRNSIICKIAGFSSTLSSEASVLFIFLITVDRFLVVKFPFGQLRMSTWVVRLCCGMVWFIGVTLALIPLLPFFSHWEMYTSNGMCLALPLMNTRQPGWQFSVSVFIIFNFIIFILISFGQLLIYKAMTSASMDTGLQSLHARRIHDFTVARNLSLIAITDFMCWFPIGVTGMIALNGNEIGISTYTWLAVLVMPVNSAINPLIYTIPALKRRWRHRRDAPQPQSTSANIKK